MCLSNPALLPPTTFLQTLLTRFSEENGRLAKENDRLRAGRQMLSQEHGEVRAKGVGRALGTPLTIVEVGMRPYGQLWAGRQMLSQEHG